eukprot:7871697-Heterocapsa_arctica.AAC.1
MAVEGRAAPGPAGRVPEGARLAVLVSGVHAQAPLQRAPEFIIRERGPDHAEWSNQGGAGRRAGRRPEAGRAPGVRRGDDVQEGLVR